MLTPANVTAHRRKPLIPHPLEERRLDSSSKAIRPSCRLSISKLPFPDGRDAITNDDDHKHQDNCELMELLSEQVAHNHRSPLNTPHSCIDRQYHKATSQLRPANSSSLFICSENANAPTSRRETGAIDCLSTLERLSIFRSRSESHLSRTACELELIKLDTADRSVDLADQAHIKHSLPELSVRSSSDNESGCCCVCHHQLDSSTFDTNSRLTSATLNDTTDEEEDEEDFDLLYETRSALDYVEESPPNNDLSTLSSFVESERQQRGTLEAQLYCSLTNDSTISRQNSPSYSSAERNSQASSSEISDQVESLRSSTGECEGPDSAIEGGQFDEAVSDTNLDEVHAPPGINQLESSIRFALRQMGIDENNECASIHTLSNDGTTSEVFRQLYNDFSSVTESRQGEAECPQSSSKPSLKRLHEDGLCAHKRRGTSEGADREGNPVKLKLDNDANLEVDNKASSSLACPLRIECERDAFSPLDADELTSQTDNSSASMRAAKDLAKLSLPSLSSLQYIPGQLDSGPTRSIDRTPRKMTDSTQNDASVSSVCCNITDGARPLEVHTVENKSLASRAPKHDHPCLLHRLCFCNCMALDQSDPSENLDVRRQDSPPKLSSRKQRQATTSSSASASPSSSVEPQGARIPHKIQVHLSPTNIRGELEDLGKFARHDESALKRESSHEEMEPKHVTKELNVTARDAFSLKRCKQTEIEETARGEHEKQSLSFLKLLKSSSPVQYERIDEPRASTLKSPSQEVVENKSRGLSAHSNRTISHLKRGPLSVRSDGLGSIGDLPTSGRSSSASDTKSNSESFPGRRSVDILSDFVRPESSTRLTDGTHEVCRHCKHQTATSDHKRRLRSFRKLLKPNKLFTSTSSVCEHANLETAQTYHRDTRSFLSRSLSRLSKRKSTKVDNRNTDNDKPRSGCTSPDNSFSNNSHLDTFESSVNSLEELNLTKSLPYEINRELSIYKPDGQQSTRIFNAPEIILSTVEYRDLNTFAQTRDNMTSSKVRSPDRSRHQAIQNVNLNSTPLERAASGTSLASDDSSVDSLPHGPSSLQDTPGRGGRHRSHQRSPRLSQSPVPFQSPATQSTKVEDGLKVCCIEHFEKHISHIKDDQVETQKNLFTTWINYHAPNLIRGDLIEELRDGIKLIGLLAFLTHDKGLTKKFKKLMSDRETYLDRLVLSPGGQMRTLSNISFGIEFLRENTGMKLVNLNPMDILSGKSNVILGLCWNIILHFQMEKGLECQEIDKQRLLSMEQTMRNWISYKQSCLDLKNWLEIAEKKLADSLQPDSTFDYSSQKSIETDLNDRACPSDRLADLIEFFELESVDIDNITRAEFPLNSNSLSNGTHTGSFNNSLSSSMLSLGSDTSRIAILANSNKASYHVLFDNFELKCRLLATMVEPDQRTALLTHVKKLRARLKHIIDIKLPQVLNEIRISIDRCIEQHNEVPDELEDEPIGQEKSESSLSDIDHREVSPGALSDEAFCPKEVRSDNIEPKMDVKLTKRGKTRKIKARNKKASFKGMKLSVETQINLPKTQPNIDGEDDNTRIPFYKELWKKICRASRMSYSLNIILLVCLAGACIIPLIQKEACCELNQAPIVSELPLNQRPT